MPLSQFQKVFVIDKNGVIRYTSIGNFEGSVTKLAKEN